MRKRLRVGLLAWMTAWTLIWSVFGFVAPPASALAKAPTGLKAAAVATNAVSLTWDPVPDATAYRVRMSTNSKMSSAKTWDVIGTSYEWTHLDPNPGRISARLAGGTTYYFQVKAIKAVTNDRANITGYSKAVAVKTKTSAKTSYLPVTDLRATPASATSLYVSWPSRGPGAIYRVRYATDPKTSQAKGPYRDFSVAGGTLTGLKPNTTYYLSVRVIQSHRVPLSAYSVRFKVKTSSVSSPALTIASYNILKTGTWPTRRIAVSDNLKAQKPDVMALQEADPHDVLVNGVKIKQYNDILNLMGSKYKYVSTKSSAGTRLAYNTDRLTLVKADVAKLTKSRADQRYAVWAILQDKQSKKKFFVLDTHLEPGGGTTASYNDVRITQAKEILALVKAKSEGLPVVVAGDMNSSRANKPTNGAYIALTEGGQLIDPLGDANLTWPTLTPTAEHPIDREYNSYNNLEVRARRTSSLLGTRVDYILVSPGVRVAQTRTVVNVNKEGRFVGIIPSDHNMLTAIVHLP